MKIYTNVKRHQDKTKCESECQLMILIYIQAVFGLKNTENNIKLEIIKGALVADTLFFLHFLFILKNLLINILEYFALFGENTQCVKSNSSVIKVPKFIATFSLS